MGLMLFQQRAYLVETSDFPKHILEKGRKDTVEAHLMFESVDSMSTGGETPLPHHVCKTLFRDNKDGDGSIISPMVWIRFES